MTTAAHAAATKAARGKRPPPNSRRRSRGSRPRPGGSPNSCHAWPAASRGWPTPKTGSAGRWRRSSTASATPTTCQTRSPQRDHHRPAEAPEHQRGGDTRRQHRPGTDPEPRRHTMDRPGPVACRRLGPVCQPGASPRRSRAVTGPAGPAPGMPRHAPRERKARAWPLGLRGRKSTAAHKEPSR